MSLSRRARESESEFLLLGQERLTFTFSCAPRETLTRLVSFEEARETKRARETESENARKRDKRHVI